MQKFSSMKKRPLSRTRLVRLQSRTSLRLSKKCASKEALKPGAVKTCYIETRAQLRLAVSCLPTFRVSRPAPTTKSLPWDTSQKPPRLFPKRKKFAVKQSARGSAIFKNEICEKGALGQNRTADTRIFRARSKTPNRRESNAN